MHVCVDVYLCMYVCMSVYVYVCICMYAYVHVYGDNKMVHVHVYTYVMYAHALHVGCRCVGKGIKCVGMQWCQCRVHS